MNNLLRGSTLQPNDQRKGTKTLEIYLAHNNNLYNARKVASLVF